MKKAGFDSDTCNHIKSALLSTCSVPIQLDKFQTPVNFRLSNIFTPKTATYLSARLEIKDSHSPIEITGCIKDQATTVSVEEGHEAKRVPVMERFLSNVLESLIHQIPFYR